jgi:hypothetical protein
MFSPAPPLICWVCNQPIQLETCKTDEHGNPVHEQCQFLRMAMAKPPATVKVADSKPASKSQI